MISAVAASAMLLAGLFNGGVAQAALPASVTLTVHYNRGDGDYASWKIYTWKNYNSSSQTDVDNGRTAVSSTDAWGGVYNVAATGMTNFDSLGFLVTFGDSWTKDVGTDRFITSFPSGKNEIWLQSGDATIYYSQPAPPAPAISSAALIGFNKFHVVCQSVSGSVE